MAYKFFDSRKFEDVVLGQRGVVNGYTSTSSTSVLPNIYNPLSDGGNYESNYAPKWLTSRENMHTGDVTFDFTGDTPATKIYQQDGTEVNNVPDAADRLAIKNEINNLGAQIYHSLSLNPNTIDIPFKNDVAREISAVVFINRWDGSQGRSTNVKIYGIKPNSGVADTLTSRPDSGLIPTIERPTVADASSLVEIGNTGTTGVVGAGKGIGNYYFTPSIPRFGPTTSANDFLSDGPLEMILADKTFYRKTQIFDAATTFAKSQFNAVFPGGPFVGIRIEQLEPTGQFLNFRSIKVFSHPDDPIPRQSCRGNGLGLPCNRICGNKKMYGGPSKGGTASSVGRSGKNIMMIKSGAYINPNKNTCP